MDRFGPLVSRGDVEAAVLAQLQSPTSGLVWWLAELERNASVAPRSLQTPNQFRGGIDFDTFEETWMPLLTVVCQPTGEAERAGDGNYGQWFEIQIGATVKAESEDDARALADKYGIAVAGCILNFGSLNGLATKTVLFGYPRTDFVNPDARRYARSVGVYHSFVHPVVGESFGPDPAQTGGPYQTPSSLPVVQSTEITLGIQ